MLPEFPSHKTVVPLHAEGALDALDNGYAEEHDRLIVEAALKLEDCATIALAQFSSARAADAVARATGKLVLTTPDSAVHKLRILLSR
jgi:hypothetical protein